MEISLPNHHINELQLGSIIFENLDLVGCVITKKCYTGEWLHATNKPIIKSTKLCYNLTNWINEDEVQKLFQNDYKGNRLSKGNCMVQFFIKLFDQDYKLVKEDILRHFKINY